MKKIFLSLLLLLFVSTVSAQTVYREFSISNPEDTIYLKDYPYWIEANQTKAIVVTNYNTNVNSVSIPQNVWDDQSSTYKNSDIVGDVNISNNMMTVNTSVGNGYIVYQNDSQLKYNLSNMSLSVKFMSFGITGSNQFILTYRNATGGAGSSKGYSIRVNSVGNLILEVLNSSSLVTCTATGSFADGNYHTATVNFNSTGLITLYGDNTSSCQIDVSSSGELIPENPVGIIIGSGFQITPTNSLNGSISRLVMYNVSLTNDEIDSLLSNVTPSLTNSRLFVNFSAFSTLITNITAQITLSGGSPVNMSFDSSTNTHYTYVTSSIEEDVNFSVNMYDYQNNLIAYGNDTLRFRSPFVLTFDFFKNSNLTSTNLESYDNEFQYAVLKYYPEGSPKVSYKLKGSSRTGVLNAIGNLFPYYTNIEDDENEISTVSDDIYLWDKMSGGSSEITVYEAGEYELYAVNANYFGGLGGLYEFGLPINDGSGEWKSTLTDSIDVTNESSTSYSVFISAWEVYKWTTVKNLFKIVMVIMLWGLLSLALAYLLTFWLPEDMRSQGFGYVIGALALTTSPLLILVVRMVWS